MKRSEMIAIIWEAINELEDADHILKRIEGAGMMPPRDGSDYLEFGDDCFTIPRYSWEPENE